MPDQPPTRENSERAVIAVSLVGGDHFSLEDLRRRLPVDAFYLPAHRSIWQCITDMIDNGKPVDAYSLADEMSKQGAYEKAGGAGYVQGVMDQFPATFDLEGHVEVLLDAMHARRWLTKRKRAEEALNDGRPLSEVARLESEAAAELVVDDRNLPRGESLSRVIDRGVTNPTRFQLAGRGDENGKQTDLGHVLGYLFPGQIAVVAGPTGVGKTAVMLSMAMALATEGTRVAYIGLEESQEELEIRAGAALSWIDIWQIQTGKYHVASEKEQVKQAVQRLRGLPLWFAWLPGGTHRDVANEIRAQIFRNKVTVVFVDYLQAIDSERDEYESIRRSIGCIERAMGRECCGIVGSQINREGTKSGDPQTHHMKGSGTIEDRARKVIVVSKGSREEYEHGVFDGLPHLVRREVKVAVKKNKGEEDEVFGFVHRTKGVWWPGYAPPPWIPEPTEYEKSCDRAAQAMFGDKDGDLPWGEEDAL